MSGDFAEPEMGETEERRSVLGRAFDILDCFTGAEPEQTIAGLCDRTGLPPATVHRLLAVLVERGAVERPSRGTYRLGMHLWRLGWGVPAARVVRDVARAHMVDLYSATGEIVVLGSRVDDDLLMVDQIAGRSSGNAWHSTRRVPLGTVAPGLLHLAHLPVPELRGLLAATSLGLPAELAGNEFLLLQTLAGIRRDGIAVTRNPGARWHWIAAPIFGREGELRSTLSLVVSPERLNPAGHGRLVAQAARNVSRGLGAGALRGADRAPA